MSNMSRSYVYSNVDKLEQLRLKKAMSLEQLKEKAESCGMARQTVQRIFDPNERSQFKKLQVILDLLDAPDDFDAYVLAPDQIVDRTIAQWDIVF